MKEIRARNQVTDMTIKNGFCTILFRDGNAAQFSSQTIPILQSDDQQKWTVSGNETEVFVRKDDSGLLIPPALSFGENGLLYIDSLCTNYSIEDYQAFRIELGDESLILQGLLAIDNHLYVYLSDNTVRNYTIINEGLYLVPDYWMNHLVEKEQMAEAAINDAEGDCGTFVFFTDAHWGKNMRRSPALIRHIIDFTPFDDVLFGGDVITSHYTNRVDPIVLGLEFQSSFAFLGTRFHCLYGNHDNNSDSQPSKTENHLSDEQVYAWLQSQMTDVVYGDCFNFYYDTPSTKTRIICLDTGRYYYSQFRNTLPKTVSFAIEALSTLPDGWHAIMASHIWCLNNTNKRDEDGRYTQYIGSFIKPILKVFDDYNARLSGQYKYNNTSIGYNFTDCHGTIDFCIGGHTHIEYTTMSEGGIPIIITISDYARSPQPGTNQEQSVMMVIDDHKNHKLSIFSVGRGTDKFIDL